MSLIRCPGCKLDTSDSLDHCPMCGAAIRGSGRRQLFDQHHSVELRPPESAPPSFGSTSSETRLPSFEGTSSEMARRELDERTAAGSSQPAAKGIGVVPKAIGLVILLVLLSLVPQLFPMLIIAVVWWLVARQKKSGSKIPQVEALKILVSEVRRARNQGSGERPLDMLRRIEQQLKTTRRT